jgi:hypothetical protein
MTMTVPESTGLSSSGRATGVPDAEVPKRARRRADAAAYKPDMLAEYEAAHWAGGGASLRREVHAQDGERR